MIFIITVKQQHGPRKPSQNEHNMFAMYEHSSKKNFKFIEQPLNIAGNAHFCNAAYSHNVNTTSNNVNKLFFFGIPIIYIYIYIYIYKYIYIYIYMYIYIYIYIYIFVNSIVNVSFQLFFSLSMYSVGITLNK